MPLDYPHKEEEEGSFVISHSFDPPYILQHKVEQLAVVIQKSKHLVALTGAGISAYNGMQDFRSPKTLWTLQQHNNGVSEASSVYDCAMPSLTHMALVALEKAGILKFVITQNVDGLHLRSGVPREKLAELRGNSFREVCSSCGMEYLRDFQVESVGLKKTPRRCSNENCKAKLRGSVNGEGEFPGKDINIAEKQCEIADTILCIGTSLQITPTPIFGMINKVIRNGGKVVIVNFNQIPEDKQANLTIYGHIDEVMGAVMNYLYLHIPPFIRVDLFQIVFTRCNRLSDKRFMKWRLRVASVHGQSAPLTFIRSVEVSFPGRPELKIATLDKQPFLLKRETVAKRPFCIMLKLNFSDGLGCSYTTIDFPVDFEAPTLDLNHGKDSVIQRLREAASGDNRCGQLQLVEIKSLAQPKGEIATFGVVTNISAYSNNINYYASGYYRPQLSLADAEAPDLKRFKFY